MKPTTKTLLDDCAEVEGIPKERGGPGFTQWEKEFLANVREQASVGPLTSKQLEKLQELWERI